MMTEQKTKGAVAALLLLAAVGALWWWWPPAMPAYASNAFVAEVAVQKVNREGVVQETIYEGAAAPPVEAPLLMGAGEGSYLRIEFQLQGDLPELYQDEPVQPSANWPITLVLYPKDRPWPEKTVNIQCFRSISPEQARQRNYILPITDLNGRTLNPLLAAGTNDCCRECGFNGPLWLVREQENEFSCSTFLSSPDAETRAGEYTYEIRIAPCARWKSSIRAVLGPSVVVYRGHVIFEG